MNGISSKITINNPNSRLRKRIIQYALTGDKFNMHQFYDWHFDNWPKECVAKNKLSGALSVINCLEKLGYKTYMQKTNMEYKLRSDWE